MNAGYWNERTKKHKHTGFSDPATYYYDQKLRKKIILSVLNELKLDLKNKLVLDYGCGTGDFSQLLSERCKNVLGFDISEEVIKIAKEKNLTSTIRFTTDNKELSDNQFSLILAITVLQHLNNEQFNSTISTLSQTQKSGDLFITLDSICHPDFPDVKENIEFFPQTNESYTNAFIKNKYELIKSYNYLNFRTSSNFQKFRNNFFIKLLNKLAIQNVPLANKLLKKIALKKSNKENPLQEKNSFIQLFIFRKI